MAYRIERLVPASKPARTASRWIKDLWGELPIANYLESTLQRDDGDLAQLPIVVGAIGPDDSLQGTVGLLADDLPSRRDLCPWVGCLVVRVDFRCRGLGIQLMTAIEAQASTLGFSDLYLFAEPKLQDYYSKQGWADLEWAIDDGKPVVIMTKTLSAKS